MPSVYVGCIVLAWMHEVLQMHLQQKFYPLVHLRSFAHWSEGIQLGVILGHKLNHIACNVVVVVVILNVH